MKKTIQLVFLLPLCAFGQLERKPDVDAKLDPASAVSLSVPLETMLGRRVVIDRGAASEIIRLNTLYPMTVEESKQYALMQVHAAGLMVVETPVAMVIGLPADEPRLRAIAAGLAGESTNSKVVAQLQYVAAADVLQMLASHVGAPSPGVAMAPPAMRPSDALFPKTADNLEPLPAASAPRRVLSTSEFKGVNVTSDERNRQIILYGETTQVERMHKLILDVDKRPQEVVINAIIGELSNADTLETSVDWSSLLTSVDGTGKALLSQTSSLSRAVDNLGDVALSAAKASSGFSAFATYNGNLAVAVRALESRAQFKVVQRPTIVTMNDTTATIYVGQQVPVAKQSLTQGGATSQNATLASTTEYIPVRLQLDVTPHIYSNNEVRLDISEKHNDVAGFVTIGGNQVPRLSEQGMNNTVVIPHGSTVLMGGLTTTQESLDRSGVPGVSRVPVIGWLFGQRKKSKDRRQIVIMLQAVINSAPGSSAAVAVDYSQQTALPVDMAAPPLKLVTKPKR